MMKSRCTVCWRKDYATRAYGDDVVCSACAIPHALRAAAEVVRESVIGRLIRSLLGRQP